MKDFKLTRKEFLRCSIGLFAGGRWITPMVLSSCGDSPGRPGFIDELGDTVTQKTDVVSVVSIVNDDIDGAVEEAIDLLGGIHSVTEGKNRIMLKPNLVSEDLKSITNPRVVKSLGRIMKAAGKEVSIAEGSAAAWLYNADENGNVCRLSDEEKLNQMQEYVFEKTGYKMISQDIDAPLVNLHTGEMVTLPVPDGYAYQQLTLSRSLVETDMLCSVPMMKTHALATVTLGIKNLIGLLPGTVYGTVRAHVHDVASEVESTGTDSVLVDLLKTNKLGLVVIDASTAMQGQGPTEGSLVKMNLIIAGTNPLATDMVGAALMGFGPWEVPTFFWAQKAGFLPVSLKSIEVRGVSASEVWKRFERPNILPWKSISKFWGNEVCVYRQSKAGLRMV